MVLVSAEIARNYFQLRGDQERLGVAERNAENQKSTYDLTVSLLEGGRGTELDTARARAQLESTLATIPLFEAAIRQSVYRLSVLTGQQPSALAADLEPRATLPALPTSVGIADPTALLQRRPDIAAAERALAAATAQIGVETADLFPRLTLEGSMGVESDSFGDLFESGAGFFGIGPRLRWAAFDLARVRAQIRAADARAESPCSRRSKKSMRGLFSSTASACADITSETRTMPAARRPISRANATSKA
jgi:multidrug efflux system outer membrane protein